MGIFDPNTFDPTSQDYTEKPQSYFSKIHESTPVFYSPIFQGWMIYSHSVGKAVMSDKRFSGDRLVWENSEDMCEVGRWPLLHMLRTESPFVNEERHRTNRAMYSGAFKPKAIERMDTIINTAIEHYCKPLKTQASVDIVTILGAIPNTVISRIIGVPEKTRVESEFKEAASLFLLGVNPFASDENKDLAENAARVVFDIIGPLVDDRLVEPRNDLISSLLEGVEDKAQAKKDIVLSVISLISAGTDTTRHSTALALKKLLTEKKIFNTLKNDRSLVDAAVLEFLRFDFPAKFIIRFAKENVEIDGHCFKKGEMVATSLHGCGWDPGVCHRPEDIDFSRDKKDYLVFGYGEHYCLGVHLARFQIKQVLNYFLDHLPENYFIDGERVVWDVPDFVLRGLSSLPVLLR